MGSGQRSAAPRASCHERPVRFPPQPLVVRGSEGGRQRTRRFAEERAARGFDRERREARIAAREAQAAGLASELARLRTRVQTIENQLPADAQATGVYSYATKQGVRWRIAVKRS